MAQLQANDDRPRRLREGVAIVGDAPAFDEDQHLLVLYASTPTERAMLEAYLEDATGHLAPEHRPAVAWIEDVKHDDHLGHAGLKEGLALSPHLTITPIGVAWRPKSPDLQSWREIMLWMRLIESNWLQRGVLRRQPKRCAIVIGEAGAHSALRAKYDRLSATGLDLHDEDDATSFANYVALQAALTIERDARTATGQTIKYPRHVKRSIWGRPAFQAQLAQISKETGQSLDEVKTTARACLKELVPKVRAPHVSLSGSFARNVSRLGYEQNLVYDKEKAQAIRDLAITQPTAFVWTHKTHIDGFAMLMMSRNEAYPLVHLIGGDNMAFFGVGYLMKRAGTVFIRRSIDCPIYKVALQSYLSYLLEKRFPVSWALEGTRSRNGKLMPPRFGILKYVVEAAAKENMQDLKIVPISIYYDLIAELGDYAVEQTGATKRKESLAWFADYLRSLRRPLGRISLGIGDPVSVDTSAKDFTEAYEAGPESFSVELQKLAFEASVSVNAVTPITPSALLTLALTGAAPTALTEAEIVDQLWSLGRWAHERGYPLTEDLLEADKERIGAVARAMIEMGVVSRYDGGLEAVFSIAEGKHFEASYYRNNAIHFFVNKAIAELALAKTIEAAPAGSVDAFWNEVADLRNLFKFEFFYPTLDEQKAEIEEELNRYDAGWKSRLASGGARELLSEFTPLVSHAVLRPFAEAYSIVADIILEQDGSETIDEKLVVAKALKLGKQAFLQRRITSEESIGKLMFANGYKLAVNRGLAPEGGADLKAARMSFVNKLNDVTKRLRLIGEIAEKERARGLDSDGAENSGLRLTVVGNE